MTVYARVVNLSEGGLFLRTHTPLDHGARASLRLTHAELPELRAEATVMWTRADDTQGPPGMGLKFAALSLEARTMLRQLLSADAAGATSLET